jgi:hypothetical protein
MRISDDASRDAPFLPGTRTATDSSRCTSHASGIHGPGLVLRSSWNLSEYPRPAFLIVIPAKAGIAPCSAHRSSCNGPSRTRRQAGTKAQEQSDSRLRGNDDLKPREFRETFKCRQIRSTTLASWSLLRQKDQDGVHLDMYKMKDDRGSPLPSNVLMFRYKLPPGVDMSNADAIVGHRMLRAKAVEVASVADGSDWKTYI